MEINVRDDRKIVEVWLTKGEKQGQALGEEMKKLYQKYKKEKYLVAAFMSGDQDLAEETSALLCYNRKSLAEREVCKKRPHASKSAVMR